MPPPSSSSADKRDASTKKAGVDNYGIDLSGESGKDEDKPRPIPQWECRAECLEALKKPAWISEEPTEAYFACEEKTPNLKKMLGVRCV
jgi:hypothetical protein